jgi:hypothetical protein
MLEELDLREINLFTNDVLIAVATGCPRLRWIRIDCAECQWSGLEALLTGCTALKQLPYGIFDDALLGRLRALRPDVDFSDTQHHCSRWRGLYERAMNMRIACHAPASYEEA